MREMLEVKHLTYEVTENGKPRRLVDDVSFSVGDGEMNGRTAGKSCWTAGTFPG